MAEKGNNTEQLRAQAAFLLSQAKQESFDIQRALSAAGGSGAMHPRLTAAAAQISGAISQLSQALGSTPFSLNASDISALKSAVAAGETAALLNEAQAATATEQARNLAAASMAVRQEVQSLSDDLFEKKIFDPYLRFSSAEDEAGYRRRQAEAQRYINEQLARDTPQGNLNAAEATERAFLDAGAHGADKSPEYAPKLNELHQRISQLRAAMPDHGRADADRGPDTSASSRSATRDTSAGIDFAAMDAKLEAAGLQAPASTDKQGHGLSIAKPADKAGLNITD